MLLYHKQYSRTTTLTNDHPSRTTTFRVTDSNFCSYTNPSRATIPLIRPHQCDSEGGRIRGVLLFIAAVMGLISHYRIQPIIKVMVRNDGPATKTAYEPHNKLTTVLIF